MIKTVSYIVDTVGCTLSHKLFHISADKKKILSRRIGEIPGAFLLQEPNLVWNCDQTWCDTGNLEAVAKKENKQT